MDKPEVNNFATISIIIQMLDDLSQLCRELDRYDPNNEVLARISTTKLYDDLAYAINPFPPRTTK